MLSKGRQHFFSSNFRSLTLSTEQLMPKEVELPRPPQHDEVKDDTDNIPSLLKCPIGLELMLHPVTVRPCKHNFEKKNIDEWRSTHSSCPCCRTLIRSLEDNVDLKEVVEYCLKLQGKLEIQRDDNRKMTIP